MLLHVVVEFAMTMNNERSVQMSVDSSTNNRRRAKVPSAMSVNRDRCGSVTATAE